MPNKENEFNQKKEYDQFIKPIIDDLKKSCYNHNFPMFLSCAVSDDGKSTKFENEMIAATDVHKVLSEDDIAKYVKIVRGFDVCSPQDIEEIEY